MMLTMLRTLHIEIVEPFLILLGIHACSLVYLIIPQRDIGGAGNIIVFQLFPYPILTKPLSTPLLKAWLAIPQCPGVQLAVVPQEGASHSAGSRLLQTSSNPLSSSRSSARALSPPLWDQISAGGEH